MREDNGNSQGTGERRKSSGFSREIEVSDRSEQQGAYRNNNYRKENTNDRGNRNYSNSNSNSYEKRDNGRPQYREEPSDWIESNSYQAGTIVTLEVAREVPPNGYFLSNGVDDVLLHYSEVVGKIKPGDHVDAFIYHDTYDRMMATMKRPLLQLGELAQLEVVDTHPRLGVFLEMGLGRNLLLPTRELSENKELRPVIGDRVFVTMNTDKSGRLIARAAREEELAARCVRAPESWKNQWIDVTVYKPLQMGAFVVCDAGVLGFGFIGLIPAAERVRPLRQGETVKARIAFVREEDGRVNLSMRQLKQVGRLEDADVIMELLKDRPDGGMPYSDSTPADIIQNRFGLSKSAFKRALGKLMKDGLIEQRGNWTYLAGKGTSEGEQQEVKKD